MYILPALPALGPGVGKVDDENQLDEDEGEAAEQPEVHPGGAEGAVRDEECADAAADHDHVLDAPEAVLPPGPRVPRRPHLRLTCWFYVLLSLSHESLRSFTSFSDK